MKKNAISREFFPWNLFATPISEKFLAVSVPYPFLDARNESQSAKRFPDTPMWNSRLSERIVPMTKVGKNDPGYVWYSPVEAECFWSLPPACIETAEFDCLIRLNLQNYRSRDHRQ